MGKLVDLDLTTGGVVRVALTNAGAECYERLCRRALRMPAAQFLALCHRCALGRRLVDDDPDPSGGTAAAV